MGGGRGGGEGLLIFLHAFHALSPHPLTLSSLFPNSHQTLSSPSSFHPLLTFSQPSHLPSPQLFRTSSPQPFYRPQPLFIFSLLLSLSRQLLLISHYPHLHPFSSVSSSVPYLLLRLSSSPLHLFLTFSSISPHLLPISHSPHLLHSSSSTLSLHSTLLLLHHLLYHPLSSFLTHHINAKE